MSKTISAGRFLPGKMNQRLNQFSRMTTISASPPWRISCAKVGTSLKSRLFLSLSILITCYFFYTEYSKRLENGRNNVEDSPMFQTGLGKSIVIKHSSIEKAISVLGGEDVSSSGIMVKL